MNQPFQIAPGPIYQKEVPVRDEAYKRFIRMLPCVVCLKRWGVETAHTGAHSRDSKASDLRCIPLCQKHHRKSDDSYHKLGRVKFEARHKLDIDALVLMFNSFYQTKMKKAAA